MYELCGIVGAVFCVNAPHAVVVHEDSVHTKHLLLYFIYSIITIKPVKISMVSIKYDRLQIFQSLITFFLVNTFVVKQLKIHSSS